MDFKGNSLECSYPFWIVRRRHDGRVLCDGKSKYLVHPGVRCVVRAWIALWFPSRGLAVRTGRGCLGSDSVAAVVASDAVELRFWKTYPLTGPVVLTGVHRPRSLPRMNWVSW
jgi:hypothetical protein